MATDMYDAYGSEQPTVGGFAKDLATSPFKMATYAGFYAQWPGMYSIGKGVWVPYIGKNLEKGGMSAVATGAKSLISQAYSQKGVWGKVAGTGSLIKEFGNRTLSLGRIGGGYVGEKWMNKQTLRPEFQSLYNKVYKESETMLKSFGKHEKYIAGAASIQARKAMLAAKSGKTSFMIKFGSKFGGMGQSIKIDEGSAGKSLYKYGGKRIASKLALGAAKGASFIGGAMLAWDLISMVGEPIGRAAIRGLDNLMGEYQRRFLPETGGRLELSYLSQGAATERQRAINAISKSYINGRSAFGSEAEYLHKGY